MRKRRRRRRLRKKQKQQLMIIGAVLLIALGVGVGIHHHQKVTTLALLEEQQEEQQLEQERPDLDVELLTVNPYSRPGIALEKVNGIVIHYTANPGTDAMQNRDYFEGLKDNHMTKASSHFIIGLDGTIVQCIPTTEISYASNDRNYDTLSIECCHEDDTGKFNKETYDSLVSLVAWLAKKYDLTQDDIIRHYDVTGKICPKYYVEHEDAWEKLKDDIGKAIAEE